MSTAVLSLTLRITSSLRSMLTPSFSCTIWLHLTSARRNEWWVDYYIIFRDWKYLTRILFVCRYSPQPLAINALKVQNFQRQLWTERWAAPIYRKQDRAKVLEAHQSMRHSRCKQPTTMRRNDESWNKSIGETTNARHGILNQLSGRNYFQLNPFYS